jgi:RNA polymerase sigma factor (sigma-70 family)
MESDEITNLVQRARAGDQAAWNAIVDEYANLVGWVVRSYRLGASQAADAAQTTWLRLIEHLDSVRQPDRLGGWLSTTARRVCLEIMRQSRREYLVDSCEDQGEVETAIGRYQDVAEDGPEARTIRQDQQRVVRGVLATFSDRDRTLLELLASDDVSYKGISARLGMPIGSIGPTRARLLVRLRLGLEAVGVRDATLL